MGTNDGFQSHFYSAPDGLKLHARIYGEDRMDALPVVCLAGLTRNARDFHDLALYLSGEARTPRKVVAFDYRGRGKSEYDKNWKNYDPVVEAGDVVAGLIAFGIEQATFVGTSRGGLIIHVLAAMRPAIMKAAVLNDIGPVVEGAGLALIRSYLERAPRPASIQEAIAIQRAANGPSFTALTDSDWERFIRALYREDAGKPVADFDPALLKTIMNVDLNKPLPTLWPQFAGLADIPLLAIRGENSKLLSASTLEEMASRHPDIQTVTVAGQGHAPLLETGKLPATIAAFIDRADAKRRG